MLPYAVENAWSRTMARLICLCSAAAAAAEAKPLAPRPAPSPWAAEPTAEQLHSLHEKMPHGEEMPEEEMAASFQRFLDARGGRFEPIWANHSHAERTANLQDHASQMARIMAANRPLAPRP